MNKTQIAVPIDVKRKQAFTKILRSKNITTKAFITFCIDALINGELNL